MPSASHTGARAGWMIFGRIHFSPLFKKAEQYFDPRVKSRPDRTTGHRMFWGLFRTSRPRMRVIGTFTELCSCWSSIFRTPAGRFLTGFCLWRSFGSVPKSSFALLAVNCSSFGLRWLQGSCQERNALSSALYFCNHIKFWVKFEQLLDFFGK